MMRFAQAIALAAALAIGATACDQVKTAGTVATVAAQPIGAQTPADAKKTVLALKEGYAGVLTIAVAYNERPRCGSTAPRICSDAKVVEQMRKAAAAARSALDAAENAAFQLNADQSVLSAAIATATQALDAFKTVSNVYSGK